MLLSGTPDYFIYRTYCIWLSISRKKKGPEVLYNTVCDYTDIATYESTETICDTLDNDCDGSTDEDLTTRYYRDNDDGTLDGVLLGTDTSSFSVCQTPPCDPDAVCCDQGVYLP